MTAPNSICKVVRDKHENTVAVFDVDGNVTLEVTCYNGFYAGKVIQYWGREAEKWN